MHPKHILIAVLTSLIWGGNFVAIKGSYEVLSPFMQLFLRFAIASLCFIFFVPRPNCAWTLILRFGMYVWVFELMGLGFGLWLGMPPGLASLLMQTQALFAIVLMVVRFGHRPQPVELAGLGMACCGLLMIGASVQGEISLLGFACVIAGAFSAACGTMVFVGQPRDINMLSAMAWSCTVPLVPMALCILYFDGLEAAWVATQLVTWDVVGAVLYVAILSTIVATSLCMRLLQRYGPGPVVPFFLLVPCVGMTLSHLIYGEVLTPTQWVAGALILSGVTLTQCVRRAPFIQEA